MLSLSGSVYGGPDFLAIVQVGRYLKMLLIRENMILKFTYFVSENP